MHLKRGLFLHQNCIELELNKDKTVKDQMNIRLQEYVPRA